MIDKRGFKIPSAEIISYANVIMSDQPNLYIILAFKTLYCEFFLQFHKKGKKEVYYDDHIIINGKAVK